MSGSDDEEPSGTAASSGSNDFSASEDEWVPETKNIRIVTSSSDSDEELVVKRISNRRTKNVLSAIKVKPVTKSISSGVKKTKTTFDSSDSGSSGDDHLVQPNRLNLAQQPSTSGTQFLPISKPPVFDCNAGLGHLSDSESSDDMQDVVSTDLNRPTVPLVNLNQNAMFVLNLQKAKEQLINAKSATSPKDSLCDVGQLLAIGETKHKTNISANLKKRRPTKVSPVNLAISGKTVDSDSDWEEVAEKKPKQLTEDVVITLKPTIKQRKDRVQLEMEVQLKRALNKRRKEVQLLMHKTHILCWIAHGNRINTILNHPTLMQLCLAFMPSKYTYPKDRTDIAYVEQITKWYASQMKLKHQRFHPGVSWPLPPLAISLALQIKSKAAICKKMYILMFVILLRAIGVQCRLVMNLVLIPIRPASTDLVAISEKSKKNSNNLDSTTEPCIETMLNKKTFFTKTNSIENTNMSKSQDATRHSNMTVTQDKQSATSSRATHSSKSSLASKSSTNAERKQVARASSSKVISDSASKTTSSSSVVKSAQSSLPRSANKSHSPKTAVATQISPHFAKSQRSSSSSALKQETQKPQSSKNTSSSTTSPHFVAKSQTQHLSSGDAQTQHALKPNVPSTSAKRRKQTVPVIASPISGRTRTRATLSAKIPHLPQLDGNDDRLVARKKPNLKKLKRSSQSRETDDSDYVTPAPTKKSALNNTLDDKQPSKKRNKTLAKVQSLDARDRRLVSTDVDDVADVATSKQKDNRVDMWVEVYSESNELWISVDLFKQKVHSIDAIRNSLTKPISYVLAWNNDNSIKDVSSRYCTNWNTVTRRQRVERAWLDQTLHAYRETASFRTRAEDMDLNRIHVKEPLPKAIGEFKDHPLYALQRHLLKFQGIYPPDAPTLGFIRGEPIYARDCVHTMHSREIWVKEARVVRPGQTAYKVVKARPKWDRHTNTCLEAQPLELFGHWQTQPYDPPTAENGMVPRNAYGNVELFKPEMLPKKTVHLQLPGLNRTCKKMNIDCASAVVGFDFHSGSSHPTYDGFVVCEEFAEQAVAQYWLDQEEALRREEDKVKQRVYGNWKKLIRGLLIRQRLQRKYNFKDSDGTSATAAPNAVPKTGTSAKRSRK